MTIPRVERPFCGLTLHQPYATLVACGAKSIETRSWATSYRGPLLIHAARRWNAEIEADCCRSARALREYGWQPADGVTRAVAGWSWPETLGHVLAVVNLVSCRPAPVPPEGLNGEFGLYGAGRFGWYLEDIVPIDPPVPHKGMQGIWRADKILHGRVIGGLTREVAYVYE